MVTAVNGKMRLVIDLRHINYSLWKQTVKYEDIRVAVQLMKAGDHMVTFDLKSGYHHIDIHLSG